MATEVNTKRDRKFQQKITTREIRKKGRVYQKKKEEEEGEKEETEEKYKGTWLRWYSAELHLPDSKPDD